MSAAKLLVGLFFVVPFVAGAGKLGMAQALSSATKSIQLIAVKRPSIGINLENAGPVIFNLNGTGSLGSASPAWVVNWNLLAQSHAVRVCLYLSGPVIADTGNSASIPPDRIQARTAGSDAFRSLSGTACGRANAAEVSTTLITEANRKGGSKRESVALRIDDRGLTLPSGTYLGTLNIVAEVVEGPATPR